MIVKRAVRLSLVLATLAAASASQAQVNLLLASAGIGGQVGPTTADFLENVFIQSSGSPALSSLTYSLDISTLTGAGVYAGLGGSLDFNYQFSASSYQVTGPSGGSIDGTWTFAGGTGGYAGFTSGSGTLALTFLLTSPTSAMTATTFQGMLAPEPGTYLPLSVGALGLLVRRRRKA